MFHRVEIYGDKLFLEKATRMQQNVQNAKPGFLRVGAYLIERMKTRFTEEGPGWAELSPQWFVKKTNAGHLPQILRMKKHGPRLRTSLTILRSEGSIFFATDKGLTYGTSIEYAPTMQEGGTGVHGSVIPARPFLVIEPEDNFVISEILAQYFSAPFSGGAVLRRPAPRKGPFNVAGLAKGKTVYGERSGAAAYGGKESLRGPGGRFVGVTEWDDDYGV